MEKEGGRKERGRERESYDDEIGMVYVCVCKRILRLVRSYLECTLLKVINMHFYAVRFSLLFFEKLFSSMI